MRARLCPLNSGWWVDTKIFFYTYQGLVSENQWRYLLCTLIDFSSVQSLIRVWLFVTPWIAACQASLSITNSQSLLKVMSNSLQPHGLQHARLPYPSLSYGVHSHSDPLSRWCHPTILSTVVPLNICKYEEINLLVKETNIRKGKKSKKGWSLGRGDGQMYILEGL